MKIYHLCKECGIKKQINCKCDTCGKEGFLEVSIHIDFSYGHDLDGASYDFCSYSCLLKFILEELKKQLPKGENNV